MLIQEICFVAGVDHCAGFEFEIGWNKLNRLQNTVGFYTLVCVWCVADDDLVFRFTHTARDLALNTGVVGREFNVVEAGSS